MPDEVIMPEKLGDLQSPPRRRIADFTSAQSIAVRMDEDDFKSASDRRAIDALFDGEVPFDQQAREEMGLGHLANFNCLGAHAKEMNAQAAYVDLVDSPRTIVNFEVDSGDEETDNFVGDVLDYEFDYLHDRCTWFKPNVLRTSLQFIRHGVAVAYRDNEWDWRWKTTGWMNFRMERGTEVGEQNMKMSTFFRWFYVDELWEKIEDEEVAIKFGWNPTEVKMAIAQADVTQSANDSSWHRAWDRFQLAVKENSYYLRSSYGKVGVKSLIVREFDGRYSLYLFRANGGTDFLCKLESKFDDISHLLTIFTYGVGDGTYHTIRGMGFQSFFEEQAINRLWCKTLDGTDLAGMTIFQPSDMNEFEVASISTIGPFAIIPFKGTFPDTAPANIATQVLPVLQAVKQDLATNLGQYRAVPVSEQGSQQGVTATEYRGRTVEQTVLSSAQMTLFYDPMERTHWETWRRLINPKLRQSDPGGKDAFEFRARVMKKLSTRNIQWEIVKDVVRVRCNRAMGNGSPQMRQNAAQQLLSVSGYLDEEGRREAVRTYVASIPGVTWRHADRFAPALGPRTPADAASIAAAQNAAFGSGVPQPVFPNELLWTHAEVHADYLSGVAQALDNNQMDPLKAMPILAEGLQHLEDTEKYLEQDKGHQPEANAIRRMIQMAAAIFERWQEHLLAQDRRAQQDQQNQPQVQPVNGQPSQPDMKTLAAQQDIQHKAELHALAVQEAQQNIKIRQEDHEFKLRSEDLLNAQKVGQNSIARELKLETNGA